MATNFPTSLQDLDATRGTDGQTLASPNHVTHHTTEDDTIEALQAKVGVDNSAVTSTLDYKLKNTASVSPGHKHTLTATDFTDVAITAVADGNVLTYSSGTSKWINSATSAPDASTSVKGVTKLSVAPVSASDPIAVGDNDTRMPTQGENDGLAATTTPATSNKFMTQKDLQIGAELYAADAGGSDTYAITLSPAPASYTTGMKFSFKANTANTGAATLNVNSLGAKTIKKNGSDDLNNNDIKASQIVSVIYDGTNFQLLSQISNNQVLTYAAGDNVIVSSDTEKTINNASFTLMKEIALTGTGTVTVYFEHKSGTANASNARIYKNGSAVGTDRSTSSTTYTAWTENIGSISSGDLLQIYGKTTVADPVIQNFRVKITKGADGSTVNTA